MGSEAASSQRLTQADRSALSERRTLEAAVALMGERGYEKTTLAAIGEAAGYSRGVATHLFGSKPDLFARVIHWISDKLRQQVEPALRERGGVDALCAFVDAHRRFADQNPGMTRALYVLWFQSLVVDSPMRDAAIDSLLGHRERIRRILVQGIASGTVRSDAVSLDEILGDLHVDAQGGAHNVLTISDAHDPDADGAVVVTDSAVTGLAPADIFYTATGGWFEGLYDAARGSFSNAISVYAGTGGDAIRVLGTRSDAAHIEVTAVSARTRIQRQVETERTVISALLRH